MRISTSTLVRAPRAALWDVVADIENAPRHVSGVEKVEVLARPSTGLVGLKWAETRTLFGKPAVATMWITEAVEGEHYQTRAEDQGAVFTKRVGLVETREGTTLSIDFRSAPETFGAKVADVVFRPLMVSVGRKALEKDLADLKKAAEARVAAAAPAGAPVA